MPWEIEPIQLPFSWALWWVGFGGALPILWGSDQLGTWPASCNNFRKCTYTPCLINFTWKWPRKPSTNIFKHPRIWMFTYKVWILYFMSFKIHSDLHNKLDNPSVLLVYQLQCNRGWKKSGWSEWKAMLKTRFASWSVCSHQVPSSPLRRGTGIV